MSFVGKPFDYDVFISYSHGDVDGDGKSLLKQWSAGFARQLEEELKVTPDLGRHIKVFLDQHHRPDQGLDPQIPLTDQLKLNIGASAVLAVLMSPHYLDSTWCRDEREWWFASQQELKLSAEGRAAIARIWENDDDAWPSKLVDNRGHRIPGRSFFDVDMSRPYEWPEPGDSSGGEFRKALLGLAGDITKHLRELKLFIDERNSRERSRQDLQKPGGQTVYLHGSEEQADLWEDVYTKLEQEGFILFPDSPDPPPLDRTDSKKLSDSRVRILTGCDALLLLGTEDTRSLSADMVVVGRQDRHEAKDASGKPLPCAVLDTVDLASTKQRMRSIARRLGIGWINSSKPVWLPDMHDWLSGAGHEFI